MIDVQAFPQLPSESQEPDPAGAVVVPNRPAEDPLLLTRMLRVVGSVLVIAAASTFMLQRWHQGNDLLRYGMLLTHTALLAVAAYVCGVRVRESRGARTFLALLLAAVPANFAVLGGLVYSQFRWDPHVVQLPSYATWVAPSPALALGACLVAVLVLAPLCLVAFLALARCEARLLTLAFVGGNLVILLPIREPDCVAAMAGLLGLGILLVDIARLHPKSAMVTLEGRLARAMLAVPPVLIVARCIHLYHPTLLLAGVVGLVLAHALYTAARRTHADGNAREGLLGGSACFALLGWGCCALELHDVLNLPASAKVPLLVLPAAALLFWYSLGSPHGGKVYRLLASLGAFGMTSVNLLVYPEWLSSLSVLVVGVALLTHGAATRSAPALVSGAASLLIGLGYHVWFAMRFEGFAWVALSVLGVGLIVMASYVERHRSRFFEYLRRVRGRGEDAA
jgi:hypothetical protein